MSYSTVITAKLPKLFLFLFFTLSAGIAFGGEPTVQPSSLRTGVKNCVSIQLLFSRGNGGRTIIIAREGSAVTAVPVDGTVYTPNNVFGSGDEISTGQFVVFNNIKSNVTVTNLKQNTTYYFAAYEHDDLSPPDYYLSGPATHSEITHDLKPDFTFSYTDSCEKTNTIYFKDNTTASYAIASYNWDYVTGTTTTKDPAIKLTKAGVNYITLTIIPSNGCTNTIQKTVNIVPNPIIKALIDDTVQCFTGNIFKVYASDSIKNSGGYNLRYFWDFGDGTYSSLRKPVKSYSVPGNYKVKHGATILSVVTPTMCVDSGYINVTVVPDPSSNHTVNDSIQCLPTNNFVFDNPATNMKTYYWDLGDGTTTTNKSIAHSYAALGAYRIIHTGVTVESCTGSDTFYVWVKPPVDPEWTLTKDSFCQFDNPLTLLPNNPIGMFSGPNVVADKFTPSTIGLFNIKCVVKDSFCPDSVTKQVEVFANPSVTLGPDVNLCAGGNVILDAVVPGKYKWSTGETTQTISVSSTNDFWVEVTEQICKARDTVKVFFGTAPQVYFPKDTTVCKGSVLFLRGTWPNSKYTWSNGSSDSVQYITQSGTYTVTVTNPCGTTTKTVNIIYLGKNCNLFVPTAFSPEGDGLNDTFFIFGRGIKITELKIFNRWGEIVYQSEDGKKLQWDGTYMGKPCISNDNYFWMVTYETPVGNTTLRSFANGAVMLLR